MKKLISNIITIFIVLLLFSNYSFAIENKDLKEEIKINDSSTLNEKEQKNESSVPNEKLIEENKDEVEINKSNSGIATMAATPISNFDYETLSDGTISITNYKGTSSDVEIPSTINGKKVTKIGSYAFYYNDYLSNLTIPDSVKEIGSYAFYWCYKIKTINFGNGIETIGTGAFQGITLSGSLKIPDSVKTIGSQAFMECYSLKEVYIGKNVSSIGNNAFAELIDVQKFTVNSENRNFVSVDGVVFDKNKTKIVAYPASKEGNTYTIPTSVNTIGASAFYGARNITNISIPNSVTTIESGAFAKTTNLTSVTLGNKVTAIADYAFNYTGITSIKIPSSVTKLDPIAFMKATKLTSITIDSGNKNYKDINGVVYSKDGTKVILYPGGKTDTNYNIPDNVKVIGESAFIDAQFTSVTIPSSVTKFEDWCFARSNITSVTIPSSVKEYGDGPFDTCIKLKTVIDNSSANIPYRMFAECTNLSSVTLNNNIEQILSRGFYNCTSLTSITLPSNLKRIEYGFLGCTKISKVDIPEKVEYISESSFDNKTQINISKTKLKKMDNGSYVAVKNVYLTGTFYYDKAKEVLDQLNQYRKQNGKSELKLDKDLLSASMERAKEIALYFDHTRPSGLSCYSACSKMEAENIAAGSSTSTGTMTGWKNSSGHNANMLNGNWNSVGIGCYYSNGIYYWVQCFSSNSGIQQTTLPSNKTEKQSVETLEDKISLYYRDSKNISLNKGQNLTVGKIYSTNLGWNVALALLEPESFEWTSSNSNVATVNNTGVINGVGMGKAIIKGNIGTKEISFNVTVALPFKDVKESDYFYDSVIYTYENKIISGKSDTKFAPNDNLTRGQLVTILYRMEGSPKIGNKNPFKDVKNEYYYNAVIWASENKVVSGYGNGKFGPNDKITRAQLATILWNYARYKKVNASKKADISTYKDYNDTKKKTSYAIDALSWAVGNKVMNGTADGRLNSTGTATRGQAAVMITNYCKNIKK